MRGEEGGGNRTINRPTSDRNRVDFENLPRFEGRRGLGLVGKTGEGAKKVSTNAREVGFEF